MNTSKLGGPFITFHLKINFCFLSVLQGNIIIYNTLPESIVICKIRSELDHYSKIKHY